MKFIFSIYLNKVMNLMNNYVLDDSDNITLLLKMLSIDISDEKKQTLNKNTHHEKDDEMIAVINDQVDEQYYVYKVYDALRDMYAELLLYMKKCDNLSIYNETLKQHIKHIEMQHDITIKKMEQSSLVLHKNSRFVTYEPKDEEFLFND